MPLLAILGLLPKLPKLFKAIKGGNSSLADKALDIARAITGQKDETAVTDALSASPDLLHQYEIALLADKHIPDQMDLENTLDARDMYKRSNHERADAIASRVMKFNPWMILSLVIMNIAVVQFMDDGALIAIASNFIGMAMKELMSQMQTVMNFFFGSSMGSKNKDK